MLNTLIMNDYREVTIKTFKTTVARAIRDILDDIEFQVNNPGNEYDTLDYIQDVCQELKKELRITDSDL